MSKYIYGKYPVQEFIKKYPDLAESLYFSSQDNFEDLNLKLKIPTRRVDSSRELAKLFGLKEFESHQGLILKLKRDLTSILTLPFEEMLNNVSQERKHLIWLPSIKDQHNLGAIVRTLTAFDFIGGIIIPEFDSVKLSPVVCKVSAGYIFHNKFAFVQREKKVLDLLKGAGMKITCIQKSDRSQSLHKLSLETEETNVFVFGSEDEGISKFISAKASQHYEIKHSPLVESLNLSVAVGIFLYESSKLLCKN